MTDRRSEVRYSETIENNYARFILGRLRDNEVGHDGVWLALHHTYAHTADIPTTNPFSTYVPIDVSVGFGAVDATRVHGMELPLPFRFGEIKDAEIVAFSHAQSAQIWHDLETSLWRQYQSDLWLENAVQSSTFVIARSLVAQRFTTVLHQKMLAIRTAAFELMVLAWHRYLQWQQDVVVCYQLATSEMYILAKEYTAEGMRNVIGDRTWNFQVMLGARAQVGALNSIQSNPASRVFMEPWQPSQAMKSVSYAISGASLGASIGSIFPVVGTLIGAIVGAVIGVGLSFLV